MTIISGIIIKAAPCCGAQYAFPNYTSMNFSATEYWTDGWADLSLMPNVSGIRRCTCGQFVLPSEMIEIDVTQNADLPRMEDVSATHLPACIANATSTKMEITARLAYWRELNHEYRERYRQHRDAEEAATKANWEAAHPDTRTRWQRFWRSRKPPTYRRPPDSPFTYPRYEPTAAQRENMEHLSERLADPCATSGNCKLERAELCRELGLFDEAKSIILTIEDDDVCVASQLISKLIDRKETAPLRYHA